jgi:transcription elongation factor Elf1
MSDENDEIWDVALNLSADEAGSAIYAASERENCLFCNKESLSIIVDEHDNPEKAKPQIIEHPIFNSEAVVPCFTLACMNCGFLYSMRADVVAQRHLDKEESESTQLEPEDD